MGKTIPTITIGLLALALLAADSGKKDAAQAKENSKKPDQKTHEVKAGPFRVELELDGVFESADMHEISLRPKEWSSFEVVSAVEHGSRVKKGDELVVLETKEIDQKIADLKHDLVLNAVTLKETESELKYLEETTPLDLTSAERTAKQAKDDLKYYQEVEEPWQKEYYAQRLKQSAFSLEYAMEELKQLQKMYKADDLTEETEEIILKRAQRSAEYSRFWHERTKEEIERALAVELPRQKETLKEQTRRAQLSYEKAVSTLPKALSKKKLELEKARISRQRLEQQLAKLETDRKRMELRSPADGIVYYGVNRRGQWPQAAQMVQYQKQLRAGGKLVANQVFLTVVSPRPLLVRCDLKEENLQGVAAGKSGEVQPTAFDDMKLPAKIKSVSAIPVASGQFDCVVSVDLPDKADAIVPGMTCKVKITTYEQKKAVAVPSKAVFSEEDDEDDKYVYVVDDDGDAAKRSVEVGQSSDKKTEILKGLKPGDQILLEEPKKE